MLLARKLCALDAHCLLLILPSQRFLQRQIHTFLLQEASQLEGKMEFPISPKYWMLQEKIHVLSYRHFH